MKSIMVAMAVLVVGVSAEAQQAKKVFRIGFLSGYDPDTESSRFEGIRLALHALGRAEGKDIVFEYRYLEGRQDRLSQFAAELVQLKPDVIVASGGASLIQAAKNATKTIPIVMAGRGRDPVDARLIQSLARPGGNITGVTNLTRELAGKRLELFKEAVPKMVRVAALYDPSPGSTREVKEVLPSIARALKLTIQPREVRDVSSFETALAAMNKERSDGLYVVTGGLMNINDDRIANFALKNRLPSIGNESYVHAGGLMSYGANISDTYPQVAWYIDKILKGSKPADLPVQQPMKYELVINLKTAKQLSLEIPQWTLMKADRVIK